MQSVKHEFLFLTLITSPLASDGINLLFILSWLLNAYINKTEYMEKQIAEVTLNGSNYLFCHCHLRCLFYWK